MSSTAVFVSKAFLSERFLLFNLPRALWVHAALIQTFPPLRLTENKNFIIILAVHHGEVVEWFKALVLKTSEVQASVGSNPTLSAITSAS